MEQKIVVHTKQGRIYKGVTQDFAPEREGFHFLPNEGGGVPMTLRIDDLKALFWVKDYLGNRNFVARRGFDEKVPGQRAVVAFQDGEEIWGTLDDYEEGTLGFFLIPADREDNNIRIFVVRSSLKELRLLDESST
jgi:hypothetical protein